MRRLRRRIFLACLDLLGKSTVDFKVHGVEIKIPKDSDLGVRYLLARGRPYEVAEAELVGRHIEPGTNVIELGGCMGVISAVIRSRIGPDAVHAIVEADPSLAPVCEANAARHARAGRTTVTAAAVDYSGKPTITFATGKNVHVGHVASAGEDGIAVPAVTLSDLAAGIPAGPFALVCDIEGAEAALFENETELLSRIDVLILETHPEQYGDGQKTVERMRDHLASRGLTEVERIEDVVCLKRSVPGGR